MSDVVCFANRDFGARVARDLVQRRGIQLVAVVTNDPPHVDLDLVEATLGVPVLTWRQYLSVAGSAVFAMRGVSALFRHRIPAWVLSTFAEGVVNLHPSMLPFGRGSYPATWAIWERTPFGATAHIMDRGIDTGPILMQRRVRLTDSDTSFALYEKGLAALWGIYEEGVLPWLRGEAMMLREQAEGGSSHSISDYRMLADLDPSLMSDEARSRWLRAIQIKPSNDSGRKW